MALTGAPATQVAELLNPEDVDIAAIEDGLELYNALMACEDPTLKGAVQSALGVCTAICSPV